MGGGEGGGRGSRNESSGQAYICLFSLEAPLLILVDCYVLYVYTV